MYLSSLRIERECDRQNDHTDNSRYRNERQSHDRIFKKAKG